ETSRRFPVQAVYFFTDMRGSTWEAAALNPNASRGEPKGKDGKNDGDANGKNAFEEIQKLATTIFVDVGPTQSAGNIAVVKLEFDYNSKPYVTPKTDLSLVASVKNFGAEEK